MILNDVVLNLKVRILLFTNITSNVFVDLNIIKVTIH